MWPSTDLGVVFDANMHQVQGREMPDEQAAPLSEAVGYCIPYSVR